jgi:hypothetical protein
VQLVQDSAFAAVVRAGYQRGGFSSDDFGIDYRPIFPGLFLDYRQHVTIFAVRSVLLPLHAQVLQHAIPFVLSPGRSFQLWAVSLLCPDKTSFIQSPRTENRGKRMV